MKDDVGKDTPGDKNVAEYKIILRKVLDNRPSGTRLKLAAALGKNRVGSPPVTGTVQVSHVLTAL